jgi:Domain of unknown function (DUF222)
MKKATGPCCKKPPLAGNEALQSRLRGVVGGPRHGCGMRTTKDEVIGALEAVESGYRTLSALPLEALSRSETYALIERLETLDKAAAGLSRRLIGLLISASDPATFGGSSRAEALARRLRISPGEAQRRIDDAMPA